MSRHIRNIRYIEASVGEHIDDVASTARRMQVPHFLHNGKLYRLTTYQFIAEVGDDFSGLRETS